MKRWKCPSYVYSHKNTSSPAAFAAATAASSTFSAVDDGSAPFVSAVALCRAATAAAAAAFAASRNCCGGNTVAGLRRQSTLFSLVLFVRNTSRLVWCAWRPVCVSSGVANHLPTNLN